MILWDPWWPNILAEMELSSGAKIWSQPNQWMIDMPDPAHAWNEKICRLGSKFCSYLPEAPASSAIAIASEEVPQVQDLEVDLSKIDLAELVWGLGVSNLNT